MKPLNIKGRVGENLTIKCHNWNVWTNVEGNTKYFCNSPCTHQKHIIITAASGKTVQEKRIQINNNKESLYVTFIKLQKSDSKKYYCGVHRLNTDPLIEVNLEVTDAESSRHRTTSSSDFISDTSTSSIIYSTSTTTSTSSSTQGSGNVLYLIICVTVMITILMVLLTLIRKMTRKQLKKEEERVDVGEIRPGNGQSLNQPAVISTFYYSADSDGLYANYTELAAESDNNYSKEFPLYPAFSSGVNFKGACAERRVTDPQCDIVYSVIQLPKKQTEHTGQSEPNQSECNENNSLYSLAQLPKTN
ncbi:CMRF35-like molecule 5 isoform X2 [Larimichthys crocea]|nr:CMRF35-like molecule 5 isoform X2 [Larimichthys crocea]XP_019113482.2 CMRF35-like molecule 5 isoform X2 [Larimichthys crocea]XP_019113483.2 CMRF35-like molecule 5 isoform X2 [Larimichthys crocea]XP_027138382.1 CMRF35-like molecule 5 isoform X2 [Larimichthys crocea]